MCQNKMCSYVNFKKDYSNRCTQTFSFISWHFQHLSCIYLVKWSIIDKWNVLNHNWESSSGIVLCDFFWTGFTFAGHVTQSIPQGSRGQEGSYGALLPLPVLPFFKCKLMLNQNVSEQCFCGKLLFPGGCSASPLTGMEGWKCGLSINNIYVFNMNSWQKLRRFWTWTAACVIYINWAKSWIGIAVFWTIQK